MVHDLRMILRLATGRPEQPTAAHAGCPRQARQRRAAAHARATTGTRKGKEPRCLWRWTRSGSCSPRTYRRRTKTSAFMSINCSPTGRRPPARACRSPAWTRATMARRPQPSPQSAGLRCKWLACPGRRRASSFYLDTGWWSDPSHGRHAAAVWPATTNACPPRWRACLRRLRHAPAHPLAWQQPVEGHLNMQDTV